MGGLTKINVPLTKEEQTLTKQYLVRGELGLTERGFTTDQVQEFLARPEIQTYLRHVYDDYVEKDARRDRVNYFALTELERLVSPAIAIIARALTGIPNMPTTIADPNPLHSIVSEQQYNAAVGLLDRLGIKVSNKTTAETKVNPVTALNNIQINVSNDVLKDTVSIEKVLSCIDMVMSTAKKAAHEQMKLDDRPVIEMKRLPDKTQTESSTERLSELRTNISKGKSTNGEKKKKKRSIK